jgi:hypothetical protein
MFPSILGGREEDMPKKIDYIKDSVVRNYIKQVAKLHPSNEALDELNTQINTVITSGARSCSTGMRSSSRSCSRPRPTWARSQKTFVLAYASWIVRQSDELH